MTPVRSRFWALLVRLTAFLDAATASRKLLLHAWIASAPTTLCLRQDESAISADPRSCEIMTAEIEKTTERGPPYSRLSGPPEALYLSLDEPVVPFSAETALTPSGSAPGRRSEPSDLDFHLMTPEVLEAWEALGRTDPVHDLGDQLLRVPDAVINCLFSLVDELVPRREEWTWTTEEQPGVLDRLLDFGFEPRKGPIFPEFMAHLVDRETRYFSKFGDSELNTPSFQDGESDADLDELREDQGKVLWDALRKTYFSEYRNRSEKTIRDDTFYFDQWRGIDFLAVPPLMGGYFYYRGLDKGFSIGGTELRIELEPIYKWAGRDDVVSGLSAHWKPLKESPLGFIISTGLYEGDVEMDFIGIGTSAGMVRRALLLHREE